MMETSCIKTGYRSNSFDIRKRQAVEVGRYEAENGSKSVLYRDRKGYFLEECNLHPAIDESDKSVVGILTSKAYPFDRLDAYEWAREGHCDPSVLLAEFYDDNPDDISLPNVLRQCLNLISEFPLLSVYGYQAYSHYVRGKSLYIHNPKKELSTAENILRMLRPDKKYTDLEAKILDLALILNMEHGGGNNSTFTTHVVSSSGTDTYSAIAAALGSLKGPKHGGANIKVIQMFQDMKKEVRDWEDEEEVRAYLKRLLHKDAFDRRGLIYGMGHAIYSVSDPRAEVLKGFVESLAKEKGRMKDYRLYSMVEWMAPQVIAEERRIYKGVSANVDFYSGFVYSMLDLPLELYTPMFAVARIVGWSAHRSA